MRKHQERAVPLVFHGDSAQYTTHGDSITTLLWSILGSARTGHDAWDHVFLTTALVSRCAAKQRNDDVDTWEIIYKYTSQSLNCLLPGVWPQRDPFQKRWPEGSVCRANAEGVEGEYITGAAFVGFLYIITADLEYTANELGLAHFNAVDSCWACKAQQRDGPLNFRNAAASAGWRATVRGLLMPSSTMGFRCGMQLGFRGSPALATGSTLCIWGSSCHCWAAC
jgi:hypothetical protein